MTGPQIAIIWDQTSMVLFIRSLLRNCILEFRRERGDLIDYIRPSSFFPKIRIPDHPKFYL